MSLTLLSTSLFVYFVQVSIVCSLHVLVVCCEHVFVWCLYCFVARPCCLFRACPYSFSCIALLSVFFFHMSLIFVSWVPPLFVVLCACLCWLLCAFLLFISRLVLSFVVVCHSFWFLVHVSVACLCYLLFVSCMSFFFVHASVVYFAYVSVFHFGTCVFAFGCLMYVVFGCFGTSVFVLCLFLHACLFHARSCGLFRAYHVVSMLCRLLCACHCCLLLVHLLLVSCMTFCVLYLVCYFSISLFSHVFSLFRV